MFEKEHQLIEERIKAYCLANDIALAELKWQPIPFSGEWGTSTSFFQTAANEARAGKGDKVPVPQRAQEIAKQIKGQIGIVEGVSHIEAVKGYLNVYYKTSEYTQRVVDEVHASRPDFGRGAPKNERIMVEYAQPNMLHSFHIGHSRTTLLGESLARIVEFAGFDTIRATYPGDMGLGVITVVWAYDKFHHGQEPEGIHERGQWLLKIYIEATALLEKKENETLEETAQREAYDAERREMLRKWEAGDPYVYELWRVMREWALEEFRDVLRMLDVHMDVWFYESEANKLGKEIVEELIAKGIAEDERPQGGPVMVKIDEKLGLTKEKYRTMIILRSDGSALYSTNDLALAKQKFETFHVDRSIYVVDFRQSLHFQQIFKILELWGFPQAEKCYHLSYGYVTLPVEVTSRSTGRSDPCRAWKRPPSDLRGSGVTARGPYGSHIMPTGVRSRTTCSSRGAQRYPPHPCCTCSRRFDDTPSHAPYSVRDFPSRSHRVWQRWRPSRVRSSPKENSSSREWERSPRDAPMFMSFSSPRYATRWCGREAASTRS
jgi:arginyl-tRNA synthetase